MKRPLSWVAPILFAAVLAIGASTDPAPPQTFSVGECVSIDQGNVSPISCQSNHAGLITASESDPKFCADNTEGFVNDLGVTFCIDTDQ